MILFPHRELLFSPPFGEAERQLAEGLAALSPDPADDPTPFAAAWLLHLARRGAVCLDLKNPQRQPDENIRVPENFFDEAAWLSRTSRPGLTGAGDDYRPVIVEHGRLYLQRFRESEATVARRVHELAGETPVAPETLALIESLFPPDASGGEDPRKAVVLGAASRRLSLVTGGPGTGKTASVASLILALLAGDPTLRFTLAAPTGRAAARLRDALAENLSRLRETMPAVWAGLGEVVRDAIPSEAMTLHRALGFVHGERGATAAPATRADVVIVDEASMIDLPMMAALFESPAPGARLVLLGDPDQLASVDVGSVFGDLLAAGEVSTALRGAISRLTRTHRFRREEVVGRFCLALREAKDGDGIESAIAALKDFSALHAPPETPVEMEIFAREIVVRRHAELTRGGSPAKAIAALDDFRLLCARRTGAFGSEEINRLAPGVLGRRPGDIFHGLPIIITSNDARLSLHNGDCGVFLDDEETGAPVAWFAGERAGGELRRFSPSRLPAWEPAYAMSVHKAQGSEFASVALLLPPEDSPTLTRELLYTGASRAKSRLSVHAHEPTLRAALGRAVSRPSGLARRLI